MAKVNLFLDILSLRKDGFHEIKTIIAKIHLADSLRFRLTDRSNIQISCSRNQIKNSENIIFRIACFLKEKYKIKSGLDIILKKNIPISAGLGGGSSNAAVTIKMCNTLWDLHLSKNEMHTIAQRFGSDINFFLEDGLVYLTGRGEEVRQKFITPTVENLLLVNPQIPISSKDAYLWTKIKPKQRVENADTLENLKYAIEENDLQSICNNLYNSLEDGVFHHYPIIKEIKEELLGFGAMGSLMCGSGSTVFGIFDLRYKMESAEKYFRSLDFWTYRTEIGKAGR